MARQFTKREISHFFVFFYDSTGSAKRRIENSPAIGVCVAVLILCIFSIFMCFGQKMWVTISVLSFSDR